MTFVSLDTESGIIRRYSENAFLTHEAGLTCDPDDAIRTANVIEGFRQNPHMDFRVEKPRVRTYDDAVAEQRQQRAAHEAQQLLLSASSHLDEA